MSMAKTRLSRCIHWAGCPGAVKHREVRERPTHGRHGLVASHRALRSLRYDAITMLEVRGEHPVKTSEVQSRAWDQCGQAGNKIQRFQHDMGRSIPEGMFVAVDDTAPGIDTEAFGGDRRAGDITAQAFQA